MTRVKRNDRGAALVIALAFLALFSLLLVSTLTAAEGGLHISDTLKVQPVRMYSADGAIEKAIQGIRYDVTLGRDDGINCDTTAQLNGKTMYITCDPQDGSGLSQLGGSSPTLGIIALSNGAGNEAGYQQTGNSIVRIDGGLYSNSTLSFVNGNTCNGSDVNCQQLNLCPANKKTVTDASYLSVDINGVPTKIVSSNTAGFVGAANSTDVGAPISGSGIPAGAKIQNYLSPFSVSLDKPPTALASNKTVTFREDFPQLQKHCHPPATAHGKLTSLLGGCDATRVVTIQNNCYPTAVPDLTGSDPLYPADQTSGFVDRTVPACGSGNTVELEPGRYTNPAALNALSTCDKLIWFKPGTFYFDFSSAANPVWSIGGSSNKTQMLVAGASNWTTNEFRTQPVFTASSATKSAGIGKVTTSSTKFKADDVGSFINNTYNLAYGTKITKYISGTEVEITPPPLTDAKNLLFVISRSDSNGAMCDGRTNVDHAGTEFIFGGTSQMSVGDGRTELCAPVSGNRQQISLYGVKTAAGSLIPQTGCTVVQPYPTGCATVKTGGPKPMFVVHGTVYLPAGVMDLSLQTVSYQVVSRGIIARVVALGISPSADFKDPLIYSPNFGSVVGAPRRMLFTACENGPCTSGGKARLRALVRFEDTEPNSFNVSPGNRVIVESWTVLR